MSTPFYDLASLVVVPSGYKASKVYAQKPLTTDGQLAFTRSTTATRVNSAGLIEASAINVPRLDYTNSTCPKLLLEPQRTNLLTYSEQLDNAAWGSFLSASVAANTTISPDGTQNADTITFGVDPTSLIFQNYISTSNTFTISVYAKSSTGKKFCFRNFDGIGVVRSSDFTTTSSWQRFSFTFTSALSNVAICNEIGGTVGSIQVYGCQLEAGAYATSYIGPTLGAAVTRGADAASKTGISSLIGQTEGTFFAEVTLLGNTGNFNVLNTNNSTTNAITLHIEGSQVRGYVYANSSLFNSIIGGSVSVGNTYKMAYAYKSGDAALYLNGAQIGTASQSFAFSASVDKIEVADPDTYFSYQEGIKFAQTLLFKTRLTNAQLAEITTI